MENNIEVAARIRPPIHNNNLTEDVCLYADPYTKEIVLANQMSFYIDYALPVEISQSQLFDSIISSRIDYMLQGYDVSFIAYGHTNSGKTYTMLGPGLHCALSETTYGVLPRSGREIFNKLLAFRQQFGLQFKVFVSFIEICNEEAKDLLASRNDAHYSNSNISFTTNSKGLTILYGVQEIECHTISELFNCLRLGMNCRKTVRTNFNSITSLSHCVVIIKVEQKWFSNQGKLETITSQAMFVDLAGNEQMFLMSPVDSNQIRQTAIGNVGSGVISAIIASFSGQWLPSSPFTQSLLFPLLKDSFVGSTKTLLICCLSPSSSDYSETLNSLRLIDHIHTLNKYSFIKETTKFNVNNNDYQITENLGQQYHNIIKGTDLNSCSKDSIGLEFAASQWLKLVSNAEGLFNKLVDNDMPEDAREQIEQWLCLKQECEDCFGGETKSVNNNQMNNGVRSLEMIEEVTETDTKSKSGKSSEGTDSNVNTPDASNLDEESSASDAESSEENAINNNYIVDGNINENSSVFNLGNSNGNTVNKSKSLDEIDMGACNNSHSEDFVQRLNHLMDRFKLRTDKIVGSVINVSTPERDARVKKQEKEAKTLVLPKPNRCNGGRRKSILPGDLTVPDSHVVGQESIKEVLKKEQLSEMKIKSINSIDIPTFTDVNSALKEKMPQETVMNKSLLHVSARISHLEQVLQDNSTDLEEEGNLDSKETLTHEIRNLRRTRDCLVEKRRNLDAKFNKDKVLTVVEERKFLECDEAIDAIDTTIEYKNELICGSKGLIGDIENGEFEKSEGMLLTRLMKLSTMEMRVLLYKYFRKVIDLRESGRKMETQIAELDRQAETQSWKIQALSNALQQAHLESERRLVAVQKEHQEKLHVMFRHFADETGGHSSGADDTEKCRRQNKALKQRILELEAVLYKSKSSQHSKSGGTSGLIGDSSANGQELQRIQPSTQFNIPHHNLKQLQSGGALSSRTTKVTREKNKLIIQQQKTNKKTPK